MWQKVLRVEEHSLRKFRLGLDFDGPRKKPVEELAQALPEGRKREAR
jgi:hypothetical protein